jgi:hypothetical protein
MPSEAQMSGARTLANSCVARETLVAKGKDQNMQDCGSLFAVPIVLTVVFSIQNVAFAAEKPYWVEPMKTMHAGFHGNPGYVAQFGDSITYSMAFWTPIGCDEPQQYLTKDDGLPKRPETTRWRDTLLGSPATGR